MGEEHPFVNVRRRSRWIPGSKAEQLAWAIAGGLIGTSALTQWVARPVLELSIPLDDGSIFRFPSRSSDGLPGVLLEAAPASWSTSLLIAAGLIVLWGLWRGLGCQRWIETAVYAVGAWVAGNAAFAPLFVPGAFLVWFFEPEPIRGRSWLAFSGAALVFYGFGLVYDRLRRRPAENLHGSARLADRADLEEHGLLAKRGIVLGWQHREGLFGKKWRAIRHDGVEHVLVLGETRAGKTSEQLIPTLLDWHGHVVVGDFKDGELYQRTAGALAARGFRVIRFAPLERNGISWNPLLEVTPGPKEIGQLMTIGEALIPLDENGIDHFPKAARELFLGLALHVLYANPPGERSIGAIRDLFLSSIEEDEDSGRWSGDQKERAGQGIYRLLRHLAAADHDPEALYEGASFEEARENSPARTHEEVRRIALGMLSTPAEELGSIASTLRQALQPWADQFVVDNTSVSDLKLGRVRRDPTPTAIFLTIRLSEIDRLGSLIRLFTVSAANRLTETGSYVDQAADTRGMHRALMILEEFPAMGRIDYVARMLSTVGGYGLTLILCAQTLSQLRTLYGENEPISGGCPVTVVNSTKDLDTMRAVSRWAGEATVVQTKVSCSENWRSGAESTKTLEAVARPLLTVDEVRTLPEGRGLVFFPGCQPILTWKRGYYAIAEMKRRSLLGPPRASRKLVDPFCPWSTEQPIRSSGMKDLRAIREAYEAGAFDPEKSDPSN